MATNSRDVQKRADEKRKNSRSRNWCLVVYPDSAPENWRELLDNEHLSWIEGPLHDNDKNPDGELKKPHWHIILTYASNTSYEAVLEIAGMLNSPIPERCRNLRGAIRYLIHMDNPEKAQYNKKGIISHGGSVIGTALDGAKVDKVSVTKEIYKFIRDNNIMDYCAVIDYAMDNEPDWFEALTYGGVAFTVDKYITSRMRMFSYGIEGRYKKLNNIDKNK